MADEQQGYRESENQLQPFLEGYFQPAALINREQRQDGVDDHGAVQDARADGRPPRRVQNVSGRIHG